jgi:membrane protease YdiL (CAAX protease family)
MFWGPPAYVARTPWTPTLAVLATLAIIGVSLAAAGAAGQMALSGALTQGQPSSQDGAELAALAVWQALVVVLTLVASTVFGGRIRDVLALGAPESARSVYLGAVLLLVLVNISMSVVQYVLSPDDMFTDLRPFAQMMNGPQWVLALLVVGVGAPLSEELLFRGFLLSALARSRIGFAGGALISTAIWTALHASYTAFGIAEVFLIGLLFCWLLWRTGSVRIAIFCHALYNSLIVIVLRFVELPA